MELDGYFSGIEYTAGYYRVISPAFLSLVAASKGIRVPPRPRYLELGFGKGFSLLVHAVSSLGHFWGIDITSSHVEFANRLNQGIGSDVRLLNCSFEQFLQLQSVPSFDIIVAHGLWSWVSD